MNRRGFFLGLATAALCATTRLYGLATVPVVKARNLTLAEWAMAAPGSPVDQIAKILAEQNEILEDMIWRDKPRSPVRINTPLPEVIWREVV